MADGVGGGLGGFLGRTIAAAATIVFCRQDALFSGSTIWLLP